MIIEILSILRRNFITPIVIAIGVLAGALLLLGETRDAWFISVVVIINSLIGTIQELRAQLALRKLEIMNAPRAQRQRADGIYETVMAKEVKVGDILKLEAGDQVPADAKVVENHSLECDESLLTGESKTVTKKKGATVYAASIAMAGSAIIEVIATDIETKAGAMTATLRHYKPELTPLQRTISRAIQFLTYSALAVSVLIIIVYTARQIDTVTILKTITTAGVVVVPEGLLLASTLLLAFGAINLARNKVLPQKLGAIEAMALLDILCVDKTGTLTNSTIRLEKIETFNHYSQSKLEHELQLLAKEASSGNATGEALLHDLPVATGYTVHEALAFSSARKMSAVDIEKGQDRNIVAMGAPEVLSKYVDLTKAHEKLIDKYTEDGLRVLLVITMQTERGIDALKPKSATAAGIIVLSNELREGVVNTISYLQKKGVSMRVISGDNPKTVQYIAESAGIRNADVLLTGDELADIADRDWDERILGTTIFARVLPEQKQKIIETFQKAEKFTGMVGDGVNDALALKKADLGVAMFAGAAATRRVADIILLNNSFNSMPVGMKLGNKIMLAIELIATLFFHKIIYGVTLLILTMIIGELYPFMPRHITFMNIFMVTMPTLLWTLFPPNTTQRVNPKLFWRRTLWRIAPIALLSGFAVTFTYGWFLQSITKENEVAVMSVMTSTVITATLVGMMIVFLVPRMFSARKNRAVKYMRVFYILGAAVVASGAFGITFAREFFDFVLPAWEHAWVPALVVIGVFYLQRRIVERTRHWYE